MAQTQLQEELIPAGGIAEFVMSDAEISALEEEEAREQFGTAGIARFEPIAKRMASYGRFGDDTLVHAEKGELLVPRALIENNPRLKASIFNHLREMGIEDPDRYVVGSSANSINPDTGMPEFFFKTIRRAVSSVAKGVSKAVSKVGKALKKVAPVVLPIALAMGPLGAIYGAAVGSGIGTLIQGGNIKDALKSALISGASGAVFSGISSKLGGGTFTGGISDAMANPMGRFSQAGQGFKEAFSTGDVSKAFQGYQAPTPSGSQVADDIAAGRAGAGEAEAQALRQEQISKTALDPAKLPGETGAGADTGIFDKASDLYQDAKNIYAENLSPSRDMGQMNLQDALTEVAANPASAKLSGAAQVELAKEMVANSAPGMLEKYGPLAAATGAVAYGAGFFDPVPAEEPNLVDRRTGRDLIDEDPDRYLVRDITPRYSTGPYEVPSPYNIRPGGRLSRNPMRLPQMYAAAGGEVYPRRNGGIMPNEGVPDKDSVRALLMPGEFVMTKDAVRGLGNGNLNQGINNMYSMMRNLETKGRVA
jgi:hypothetical protein